jgi:steroid delta-isomerase-like uncharacterized protein
MKAQSLFITFVLLLVTSCNTLDKTKAQEDAIRANLNIFIESFWNKKDISIFETIATENFYRKMNDISVSSNRKESIANSNVFITGFPDLQITNTNIYIKDNMAFINFKFTGTNTGIFGDAPATGKKIKISGFSIIHYNENGIMTTEEVYYNELDLLQQLGYTLIAPILK